MVAIVERLLEAASTPKHTYSIPPTPPADFEALWKTAEAAGIQAAKRCIPKPMVVTEDPGLSGPVIQSWIVLEGVCGFAWVHVPGNCAFGRWAKKSGRMSTDYPKGLMYWIPHYNQSMSRKEAHAHAFAQVLTEAGISAHARSRMD